MALEIEALYRTYGPMVLRRCRFLLRDETRALDALQETFVRLLRRQDHLRADHPSSLLYRIATNVCLNVLRDGRWEARAAGDEVLADIARADDGENRALAGLVLDRLFRREAPSTREMLVLLHVDGLTLEETAAAVGLSVSGVRKRVREFKARAQGLKGGRP